MVRSPSAVPPPKRYTYLDRGLFLCLAESPRAFRGGKHAPGSGFCREVDGVDIADEVKRNARSRVVDGRSRWGAGVLARVRVVGGWRRVIS
jgi:hypothetical protein